MISWFTESSLVPLVTGTFLTLAFLGLAFSFRERVMAYVALVVLAFTVATVVTERLIVTDREAVTAIVQTLAVAVQNNDVQEILRHVSDKRQNTKDRISAEMPQYIVRSCRIVGFKGFTVSETGERKVAEIVFVAYATGSRKTDAGATPVNPQVTLDFEKTGDGPWQIISYDYDDPRGNLRP